MMESGRFSKELTEAAMKEAECSAWRIAKAFGFSREDQEDLTQDLALAVLTRADRYEPKRSGLRTFVKAIIRGEILHRLRSRRRMSGKGSALHSWQPQPADEPQDILDSLDQAECLAHMGRPTSDPVRTSDLQADVNRVFDGLTARQREICRLLGKLDTSAVAQIMKLARCVVYREIEAIRKTMLRYGMEGYLARA